MTGSFTLDGVTYHERLPRIVLLNFSNDTTKQLERKGYNAAICQPKKFIHRPGGQGIIFGSPKPPHEIDIFLARDSVIKTPVEDKTVNPPKKGITNSYIETSIVWPSGYTDNIRQFCQAVINHGGVCVFFVSQETTELLHSCQLGYEPNVSMKLWPNKTAHIWPECEDLVPITKFLQRWFNKPKVYVSLAQRQDAGAHRSLLTDKAKVIFSAGYWPPPQAENADFALALLDFGDDPEILDSLVADAIPDVLPAIFPFRHDTSWLREHEFQHPSALKLEQQKQTVQAEMEERLAEINQDIKTQEIADGFARELLLEDGECLKGAVRKVLEVRINDAGESQVKVIDVDSDATLKGGTQKREDLRLQWKDYTFLINVAGRAQYFRHSSINQLDMHKRLFVKENPHGKTVVHSLLIGNYNYAGGIDPRQRGMMFESGTAEANDRLKAAGHGAIATYDLFRLLRSQQRGELVKPEDVFMMLCTEGILNFEKFRKAPETLSSAPSSATSHSEPIEPAG